MSIGIIKKLEKAKLLGRGGASFPTSKKWEFVKKISAKKKYIVCNCSEGEPGVFKDGYILKNYPDIVIKPKYIDILCIDLNSILHEICAKIKTKEEFKKILYII